jgi:hypothetical protein
MESVVNLIRRQFHGQRKESEDSCVTTEFVAFWFLPLWPVASYRVVRKEQTGPSGRPVGAIESKEIPVQWEQAIRGWLVLFAFLGGLGFMITLMYLTHKFGWQD